MGRHKGSGEGSIFKAGKGWRGQISIDGERKSVSGKTKVVYLLEIHIMA